MYTRRLRIRIFQMQWCFRRGPFGTSRGWVSLPRPQISTTRLHIFEQWVCDKHFGNLNFIPHDFLLLVGIFFAAAIAAHTDRVRQHRKRSKRICLTQQDVMLVANIAFVVKSVVLADNDPVVVSCIFHRDPRLPTKPDGKFVLHYATTGCMYVKNRKYIPETRR